MRSSQLPTWKQSFIRLGLYTLLTAAFLGTLLLLLTTRFYPHYPFALNVFIAGLDTLCVVGLIFFWRRNRRLQAIELF